MTDTYVCSYGPAEVPANIFMKILRPSLWIPSISAWRATRRCHGCTDATAFPQCLSGCALWDLASDASGSRALACAGGHLDLGA